MEALLESGSRNQNLNGTGKVSIEIAPCWEEWSVNKEGKKGMKSQFIQLKEKVSWGRIIALWF